MEMVKVQSSNLDKVGYSQTGEALRILFLNGGFYEYESFPPAMYQEFMASPSKGRFFHQKIRGKYPTRKLN